ncbi:MAG: hypothetical protein ACRCWM_00550 [Sarcina sp.]
MNTFIFKNSSIDIINSTSTTTSKIINIDTEINVINLDTPLSMLSGEFSSKINIINDCLLSLEVDFNLIDSIINLVNNDSEKKEITIVGAIDNLSSNLKINSDNNITLNLAISTSDVSSNTVDVSLNPIKSQSESFRLNSIQSTTNTNNKPKINFQISNTKNIIVDADLEKFDTGTSTDMNLIISEKSDIKEFQNIDKQTFNSVTASENVVKSIEKSTPAPVPITSLLFKVNIQNGKGYVFIPVKRNVQNTPPANIILNEKRYPI